MDETERAAIDKWMSERDITSYREFISTIDAIGDERYEDGLDSVECDELHAEDVAQDDRLVAAMAEAIKDLANDIARESENDTLWLHGDQIARRILDHREVARVFGAD